MYQGGFFSNAFNPSPAGQRRQNKTARKKQGNQKPNPNPNPQNQQKKKQKQKQGAGNNKQVKIQLMNQTQPALHGGQFSLAAAAKNFMSQQLLMAANLSQLTSPVGVIPSPVIKVTPSTIPIVGPGSGPKANTNQPPAKVTRFSNVAQPIVKVTQPVVKVTQPVVKVTQPAINNTKPNAIATQSSSNAAQSSANAAQPTKVVTPIGAQRETEATPPIVPPTKEVPMETDSCNKAKGDTGGNAENGSEATKGKPKWMKKSKLSRAQKLKATNMSLKKILQPKNAVVVLNEMLADSSSLSMSFTTATPDCAKATVTVDNNVFEGVGHSKVAARNSAAEAALKHLILKKLSKVFSKVPEPETPADSSMTENEGGEKKVEDDGEISLGHVACFAMFKLFDAWSNDNAATASEKTAALELVTTPPPDKMIGAKKLPEDPSLLHPCMLLHQMHPNVVYDLVCVTGTSPKLCFTMKCSVNENFYIGNGPNKKAAKKDAATMACRDLFDVVYEN